MPDDHIITQVSGSRLWTLLYALRQNSRPHTGTSGTHRCWGLGGLLCNDQEPAGTLEDLLTACRFIEAIAMSRPAMDGLDRLLAESTRISLMRVQ